jgi:hypothetical protein
MMLRILTIIIALAAGSVFANEHIWSTTNAFPDSVLAKYYSDNVSTNVPPSQDKPWSLVNRGGDVVYAYWSGDEADEPTAAELDAIDPDAAHDWDILQSKTQRAEWMLENDPFTKAYNAKNPGDPITVQDLVDQM